LIPPIGVLSALWTLIWRRVKRRHRSSRRPS
jgi:hypothetical protein